MTLLQLILLVFFEILILILLLKLRSHISWQFAFAKIKVKKVSVIEYIEKEYLKADSEVLIKMLSFILLHKSKVNSDLIARIKKFVIEKRNDSLFEKYIQQQESRIETVEQFINLSK